ncbi:hypothetical protein ACJZ2D_013122 [Fusarium nematophilum]
MPPVNERDIPSGEDAVFKNKFPPGLLSLPSPDAVRDEAVKSDNPKVKYLERPPPVRFPSLGLLVKYGSQVSIDEGHCLVLVKELAPTVPVPEVYGWCEHGGQSFIYMELIQGPTLEEIWGDLDEKDRISVCQELRGMVQTWRGLSQDTTEATGATKPPFIGNVRGQHLLDIVFTSGNCPTTGPFQSVSQFHDYFTVTIGPRAFEPYAERSPHPYRSNLPDNVPIVFTHGDLHPSNIILSSRKGDGLRVRAVIDWQQAGWYPAYWESCKALWTAKVDGPWAEKYLPMIMDIPACYDWWDYFVLARGM